MVMFKMIRSMKAVVPAAIVALAMGGTTQAEVIQGTSSAYTAEIKLGGFTLAKYGELTHPDAAPAYIASNSPASLSVNVPFVISATTGVLTNTITSDVDGGLGSRTTTAESELANASIAILPKLFLPPTLSISVEAIQQSAVASGDYGSMSATSSLTVENLVIRHEGTEIFTFSGILNTQQDFNLGFGVTLSLNEQTPILGPDMLGINSNALHLRLDGVAELVLGNAMALQGYGPGAVPEPASVAMLGLGVVGAGLAGLRRRKAA